MGSYQKFLALGGGPQPPSDQDGQDKTAAELGSQMPRAVPSKAAGPVRLGWYVSDSAREGFSCGSGPFYDIVHDVRIPLQELPT